MNGICLFKIFMNFLLLVRFVVDMCFLYGIYVFLGYRFKVVNLCDELEDKFMCINLL